MEESGLLLWDVVDDLELPLSMRRFHFLKAARSFLS